MALYTLSRGAISETVANDIMQCRRTPYEHEEAMHGYWFWGGHRGIQNLRYLMREG